MTGETVLDLAFPLVALADEDLSPAAAFVLSRLEPGPLRLDDLASACVPLTDREVVQIVAEHYARGFIVAVG